MFAHLAERSQTKLLSIQGFTVIFPFPHTTYICSYYFHELKK